MPMVRSPCTLVWPRTGHTPAPGRPMAAAQQQRVDDLPDRGHRLAVLGDAHRPADDDAAAGRRPAEPPARTSPRRARWRRAARRHRATAGGPAARRPRRTCSARKSWSSTPPRSSSSSSSRRLSSWNRARSPPSLICRNSSASAVPRPMTPAGLLRVLEPDQPGLGQRVDGHDRRAVAAWPARAR